MDSNIMYKVTNRSGSMVGYSIPEDNIRREFQPGETKNIRHGELEKLTYQSGGKRLIADYFLIQNPEAIAELNIPTEPEYFMTDKEIIELINHGSLDAWLDCLDFAPEGVMEMVKKLSVELPLNDFNKRKALKEKTGFDIDAAIRHLQEAKAEEELPVAKTAERRVKKEENAAPAGRRTTPKYNIVKQG